MQEDAFQITLGAVGKFFAGTHPKSERCSTAMRFWLHCSHLLLKDLLGRAWLRRTRSRWHPTIFQSYLHYCSEEG